MDVMAHRRVDGGHKTVMLSPVREKTVWIKLSSVLTVSFSPHPHISPLYPWVSFVDMHQLTGSQGHLFLWNK